MGTAVGEPWETTPAEPRGIGNMRKRPGFMVHLRKAREVPPSRNARASDSLSKEQRGDILFCEGGETILHL